MKRSLSLAILSVIAGLLLASCSGSESGTVQPETKQASPGARHRAGTPGENR